MEKKEHDMDKKIRGKRRIISVETKNDILSRLANGERSTAVGRAFGLNEATIRTIKRRADESKLKPCVIKKNAERISLCSRNILLAKTEKALVNWIHESNEQQIGIGRKLFKNKAIQLYQHIKEQEFSGPSIENDKLKFFASNSWLNGFKKRHSLLNWKFRNCVECDEETTSSECINHTKKIIRKSISLQTKNTILSRLEKGERSTALGREFGLNEATVRTIKRRADEILKSCATITSADRTSYSRNILIEKTEKALIDWINETNRKQITIDGHLIQKKAIEFYYQLEELKSSNLTHENKPSKFSASSGWLNGFKRRYALENWKLRDVETSTNQTISPVCVIKNECEQNEDENYFTLNDTITEIENYTDPINYIKESISDQDDDFNDTRNSELIQGQVESSNDSINNEQDPLSEQVGYFTMTPDKIYEGLQLCRELKNHFLSIDSNTERTSKFQRDLQTSISVYGDLYNQLINKPSSLSQHQFTKIENEDTHYEN